jgi:protein-tyrosine phosphatase
MIPSIFVGSKLHRLVMLQHLIWDLYTICVQAFREFASVNRYPILIHCTQGKDRTGLLVALILLLLDVPLDAITYDYCLSESELLPEQESRVQEIKEIGLTEEFAKTPRNWIPELHRHLIWKYGGARSYLCAIGVDGETQDRVVDVLGRK